MGRRSRRAGSACGRIGPRPILASPGSDSAPQATQIIVGQGAITGGATDDCTGGATGGIIGGDMDDVTRWLTDDDMATALGIAPEPAKRLALRRKWPRRPGNDGRALVAVSEERLDQAATIDDADANAGDVTEGVTGDITGEGRDARALIGLLERRIDELSEEVAEARTGARGARFEAESLRVQAGRVDGPAALREAERTHVAEARGVTVARVDAGRALLDAVQAERDRLLVDVTEHRRSWRHRVVGQRTESHR